MLRIRETETRRSHVTLTVEGALRDEQLPLVRDAIARAQSGGRQVWLDLEALNLVGRGALEYLAATIGPVVRIKRCPPFLCRWIECERADREASHGTVHGAPIGGAGPGRDGA